jgi:hypothetical protein
MQMVFIGLVFVVAGSVATFFLARVIELRCTRAEPSEVMCVRESKWLGVIPIGDRTFRDVQEAWVEESCNKDGCSYRVIVRTGEANVPLTDYYSSGYGEAQTMAEQITAYAGQSTKEPLNLREGKIILGVLVGGLFVVVGLGAVVGGILGRVR